MFARGGSGTVTIPAPLPSVLPTRLTVPVGTVGATAPPHAHLGVHWTADTVDNEFAGRRSSKRCCIFHKQRAPGEFDSSDDDDDDDNKKVAGANDAAAGGGNGDSVDRVGGAHLGLPPMPISGPAQTHRHTDSDDGEGAGPSAAVRAARLAAKNHARPGTHASAPVPDPENCRHCALLAGLVAEKEAEAAAAATERSSAAPSALPANLP